MYVKAVNVVEGEACTHLILGISGLPTQKLAMFTLEQIRLLVAKIDRADKRMVRRELAKRDRAKRRKHRKGRKR